MLDWLLPAFLQQLLQQYVLNNIEKALDWVRDRVRGKKWFYRLISLQLTVAISLLIILAYEKHIRNTSFGPPIVIAAKQSKLRVIDLKGNQKDDTDGARVLIDKLGDNSASREGFLVPTSKTGDWSVGVVAPNSDSTQRIKIPEIVRLELKKRGHSELWSISRLTPYSSTPKAELFLLRPDQFKVYKKTDGSDYYHELAHSNVTDIRVNDAVRLNGIEVTQEDGQEIIWLLGYDGKLYKIAPLSNNDDLINSFSNGGELLQPSKAIGLEEHCDLSDYVRKRNFRKIGWQSLDAVEMGPGKHSSHERYFLTINSTAEKIVLFKVNVHEINAKPTIDDTCATPYTNEARWDEGIADLRPFTDGTRYLCVCEAFKGTVLCGMDIKLGPFRFHLPPTQFKQDLTKIRGQRTYFEGIAVGPGKHGTLFISDRMGTIYFRPCIHRDIGAESWSIVCLFKRFIPGLLPFNLGWAVLDMSDAVVHGQDIACDSRGGLWFAEEHYFRRIDPALFSFGYQWARFVHSVKEPTIAVLLISFVVTVILGFKKPKVVTPKTSPSVSNDNS